MAANWSRYQMTDLPVSLRKQLVKQHNVSIFCDKFYCNIWGLEYSQLNDHSCLQVGWSQTILERGIFGHITN